MTPFGLKLRQMRAERGVTLAQMAKGIGVSSAYLSALEHGHRGRPNWSFVQRIITYFNVIWDEAEELQRLAEISDPKVSVNTAGLAPEATELANVLAQEISNLSAHDLAELKVEVKRRASSGRFIGK